MPNFILKHITENLSPAGLPITDASPAAPIKFEKAFQVGDVGVVGYVLRFYGALDLTTSSAGTKRTLGGLDAILGFTLETDKHKKIIDNVDGRGIVRMLNQFLLRQPVVSTDPSAVTTGTPAFNFEIPIPMCLAEGLEDRGVVRNFDTVLDLLKAKPQASVRFGNNSAFISGGTYTKNEIDSAYLELHEHYVQPLKEAPAVAGDRHELPAYLLTLEMDRFTPPATGDFKMDIPYGDRRYLAIGISERDDDAPFDEVSDMTTDNTSKLTLRVGANNVLIDQVPISAIRNENARRLGITMPTGWTFLDFFRSGKLSDTLNTFENVKRTLRIEYNCTTVTDRQLWVYYLCVKQIPRAALRDVQIQNPGGNYLPAGDYAV